MIVQKTRYRATEHHVYRESVPSHSLLPAGVCPPALGINVFHLMSSGAGHATRGTSEQHNTIQHGAGLVLCCWCGVVLLVVVLVLVPVTDSSVLVVACMYLLET